MDYRLHYYGMEQVLMDDCLHLYFLRHRHWIYLGRRLPYLFQLLC